MGRLHMREFQFWMAACELGPMGHGTLKVLVTANWTDALRHWTAPSFLMHVGLMRAVLSGVGASPSGGGTKRYPLNTGHGESIRVWAQCERFFFSGQRQGA